MDGGGRIARGTGHQARETEVLDALEADWAQRRYGPEEQPWLAWLLRFALSEVDDPQGQGRFRMMPGALDAAGGQDERWTHVALDEAQDLSVAEASLLTSFVHPDGAVTVSADFRQAVTPHQGHGRRRSPFGRFPASRHSGQDHLPLRPQHAPKPADRPVPARLP